MKARYILPFILLLCSLVLQGKEVTPQKAQTAAQNFTEQIPQRAGNTAVLVNTYYFTNAESISGGLMNRQPLIYIYRLVPDGGFIWLSGDDLATPVLGYGLSSYEEGKELPDNVRKWLQGYQDQVSWAIEHLDKPEPVVNDYWEALLNGEALPFNDGNRAVNPLLSTTWDQSPYYNALCPGGSVTGCVATAMAQVMKYWNHPAQGTGMHSYNHPTYGTLSANFGSTTYQWSSMPASVTSANNAVATLMYHCGVGVDMNYSPTSSGAWVVEDDDPVCAESALKNYFGYKTSLHGEKRDNGYTTTDWINLIKGELNNQRPVLYAGFGSGGGHAFVCDGYNSADYFHFNWGWSGYYDGYFSIDALNPGGTGTGGGTGGYNSGHQALIGVEPQTTTTSYDLALYNNIVINPNPIMFGDAFTIHTDIANYGTGDFSGDFAAIVFDQNYNSVDWVETMTGMSLGSMQHYTNGLTFSTAGLSSVLPGNYLIGIYYRPSGGEWIQVAAGDYSNMVSFTVGNTSNIELYAPIQVVGGTNVTQGNSCVVITDILNNGTTHYYGMFDISLYYLDGSWAQTIQTLIGADLEAGYYYYDVEFVCSSVDVEPGTYYLALQHKPTGGNWELAGSTWYENPIQVIVKTQGYQPDIYESNDLISTAATLTPNFTGNVAMVYTTGSNSHVGNDYDYYRIPLASGYQYSIVARAHDSYNSGNGQLYTNDVLWSYNRGGLWSMTYDDVMGGSIYMNQGGDLYFLVAPYFLGETGTYLMDIQITRSPAGMEDLTHNGNVSVYPNPAKANVHIEWNYPDHFQRLRLVNAQGQSVLEKDLRGADGNIDLDTEQLSPGIYILLMDSGEYWQQTRLVITR